MEEAVNRCDSCKSGFVDYESLMSKSAKRIATPVLRVLQQYQTDTTNICMGGGSPDPATFPIAELQFKLKDGTVLQVDPDTLAAAGVQVDGLGGRERGGANINFKTSFSIPYDP
ncbi:hypothetical protein C0Q70_16922 [Pomacea canaliculata]|uniref:Uncharacterized protein n=1 Tax=Pomacea canaliculata TaxID=400727 RepID=A0A2T7NR47_POMCA|nr:hypothetical protein C0Q70_16922 [Pomacea canaliculata]